jgi:hypothetical protein
MNQHANSPIGEAFSKKNAPRAQLKSSIIKNHDVTWKAMPSLNAKYERRRPHNAYVDERRCPHYNTRMRGNALTNDERECTASQSTIN